MACPKPTPIRAPLPALDDDLPPQARWRDWMGQVEAVIFASPQPVPRETLAALVGPQCRLDELLADIQDELRARPYELVFVAGGWQHRTRPRFASAVRGSGAPVPDAISLTPNETLVATAIAYLQPVGRAELSRVLGREVGRDVVARLKRLDLVAAGPRLPVIGAPLTYVTTARFLSVFNLGSLRDLPDIDVVVEAGLLGLGEPVDGGLPRSGAVVDWGGADQAEVGCEHDGEVVKVLPADKD